MTHDNLANAIELYQGGLSIHDVSKRIGICPASVRRALIDAGVSIRSRREIILSKIANNTWVRPTGSPRVKQILSEEEIKSAAESYKLGKTIDEISKEYGIGASTLCRYFKLRGITTRTGNEQFLKKLSEGKWQRPIKQGKPIPDDLADQYLSGITLRELSARLHICRKDLASHLKERGIELDRRAMLIKREGEAGLRERMKAMSNLARNTSGEILKRGKRKSANTRFSNNLFIGKHESDFASELSGLGFNVLQQFPVGTYNIDIAIEEFNVAIEIECGSWHGATSMKPKRIEYLISSGWRLIIIRAGRHGAAIDVKTISEKIASLLNVSSSDPSFIGQYGVLTRQAKPSARIPNYFDNWTRIPGF